MEKKIKIGVVVADPDEYAPLADKVKKLPCRPYSYYGKKGIVFNLSSDAEIICVICGIGKVNAAAAAAHLVDEGCNILLNFGLSGGISGVRRGDLALADHYLEHDFDLTMIGYKPCEKPGQKYIYDTDERLLRIFEDVLPGIKRGTAVCGDRFICNEKDRQFLKDTFHAVSCDMETGAIAAVCDMAQIPFLALRRISDDAGDDAKTSYREMNGGGETLLTDAFFSCLTAVAQSDFFGKEND